MDNVSITKLMDTFNENTTTYSLPAIATRELSVITGMNINFDVARKPSLQALEESIKADGLILLIAQIDSDKEDEIGREDLREVGVVAKITNIIRLPYSAVKVSAKILNRIKITNYTQVNPFIKAKGEAITYLNKDNLSDSEEAMSEVLLEKFKEYSTVKARGNDYEIFSLIRNVNSPDELIDFILPALNASNEVFQDILCSTDTKYRFETVYELLTRRIRVMKLETEIEEEVSENLSKMQQDVYLREKIEVMQARLQDPDGIGSGSEYIKKLESLPIEENDKLKIRKEIDRLSTIPFGSAESGVIQTYVETILDLPWEKEELLNTDIKQAEEILDSKHYGLKDVKDRITEYLSVIKLTGSLKGPIICLVGPPGVGKTSIAKSIAQATNRKFTRLSLGGLRDEAEINGHRRTYIGAMPGRIIAGLKQVGSNSPLFLLDEIDKVSSDIKGDPASALLEVLDPEQNSSFSDHYLEVPFDLSNVLFVATANTTSTIPPALLDRMEIIELNGYLQPEKVEIATRHLIDKQLKANGLTKSNLEITPTALEMIIRKYTIEAGVRQLEREIAKIARKVAKEVVTGETKKVKITTRNIHKYLGKELLHFEKNTSKGHIGQVTGLAYTSYGGDTLKIETVITSGKGNVVLTGNLGDVMKESAQAAITFIRSIAKKVGIKDNFYEKSDIHIHVPEGATPKDGPSAGITLATALISALTKKKVSEDIAMTGEITLSGNVLPIGGLREKLLAANTTGVKTVLIPKDNEKDLEEVPEGIKENLNIIPVKHMKEVYKIIFEKDKE